MKQSKAVWIHEPMDIFFASLVVLLLTVGLIMLFSASFPSAYYETGDYAYYFKRQLMFAGAGIVLMLLMSRLDYHLLRATALPLIIVSFILIAIVLIPGVGVVRNNARRWLYFGSISVQPSELAKLAIIICFSASISVKMDYMKTFWRGVFPYSAILAVYGVLVGKEPHLSGAILIIGVGAALMFVGGIRWRYIVAGVILVSLFVWLMLTDNPELPCGTIHLLTPPAKVTNFRRASLPSGQADCSVLAWGVAAKSFCFSRRSTMTSSFPSYARSWVTSVQG